jgi:hypothetical protein
MLSFEVPARRLPFLGGSSVVNTPPRLPHTLDWLPADSADFGNDFWQTVYVV